VVSKIYNLVTSFAELGNQLFLQSITAMISCNSYAHNFFHFMIQVNTRSDSDFVVEASKML